MTEPPLSTSEGELAAALVRAAPDGVVLVGPDGTVRLANPAALSMFAMAEHDLVGSPVDLLVPVGQRDLHVAHRRRYGEHPRPRPMGIGPELRARRRDGSTFPVEVSLSPVELDGVLHTIAAVRDVTEREDARARLEVLEDRERIARDLHDMVIQRIFAVGMGLQAVASDAQPPHVADRIDSAIGALDDTIRELRTAIFHLGQHHLERTPQAEIRALVADRSDAFGITPTVDISGDVDDLSDLVLEQLLAALGEALSNVGRHAAASTVEVAIAVGADRVELTVTDDGVGMRQTRRAGGGLANLMWRAAELGGECSVGSADPTGTRLVWTVPR